MNNFLVNYYFIQKVAVGYAPNTLKNELNNAELYAHTIIRKPKSWNARLF